VVPLQVIVDSRLRIALADLPPSVGETLRAECTHSNPSHYKALKMGFKYTKEPKTHATWADVGVWLTLPRGATQRVRDVCAKFRLEPEWIDARDDGLAYQPGIGHYTFKPTLRPYQERMVERALDVENCLIKMPTGSGKTLTALAFAHRAGLPTLVLTHNTALLRMWVERIHTALGVPMKEIGVIGGGRVSVKPITVAMQQTLYSRPELVAAFAAGFGTLIVDEVQLFAARTFTEVVNWFSAKFRVGWSADHTRKDGKEFFIHDLFGRVAGEVTLDELVESKAVHDVEIRVIPTNFRADWYVEQDSNPEQNVDFNRLLDEMQADKERNALARGWVVAEASFGNQVLTLAHRREHVTEFAALLGKAPAVGTMLGGDENEFQRVCDGLTSGKTAMAVGTYKAVGVGIDLPAVSHGMALTPIATNKQFFGQVRGRICRPAKGKTEAVLYYMWDQHVFGLEPLRNLARWNNTVNVTRTDGPGLIPAAEVIDRISKEAKARRRILAPKGTT
jgi:superfamily II DNA or RNA helicase